MRASCILGILGLVVAIVGYGCASTPMEKVLPLPSRYRVNIVTWPRENLSVLFTRLGGILDCQMEADKGLVEYLNETEILGWFCVYNMKLADFFKLLRDELGLEIHLLERKGKRVLKIKKIKPARYAEKVLLGSPDKPPVIRVPPPEEMALTPLVENCFPPRTPPAVKARVLFHLLGFDLVYVRPGPNEVWYCHILAPCILKVWEKLSDNKIRLSVMLFELEGVVGSRQKGSWEEFCEVIPGGINGTLFDEDTVTREQLETFTLLVDGQEWNPSKIFRVDVLKRMVAAELKASAKRE